DSDFDGLSDGEEVGIDVIEVSVHNYGPDFKINNIEAYEITSYTLKLHHFVELMPEPNNWVSSIPLSYFVNPQNWPPESAHHETLLNFFIEEIAEVDLYGSSNIPPCAWNTLDGARLYTRVKMT